MKKSKTHVCRMVAGLLLAAGVQSGYAESNVGVNSDPTAQLNFEISIPTILFLQIGSFGTGIDTVTFALDDLPGSGIVNAGSGDVTVRAAGLVPSANKISLTVNSLNPLNALGSSTPMPFSEIMWAASGPGLSSGKFDDTASQSVGGWTGSGSWDGTFSFSYENDEYYDTGEYIGSVLYTLSSP